MFDLHGRVALLIGAEGNLGPIWKVTLEGAGAKVWTWGLPQVDFSIIDMKTLSTVESEFAPYQPDIIVCNAAIDISPSKKDARFFTDFEDIIKVNLTAHARIIESKIEGMKANRGGVIVFIGSIMGYVGADWRNYEGGFEKPVAYNCSKAALQQLARSITVQYGRYGIRAVCPGFGPVETPKLSQEFRDKITPKIPMQRFVSKRSLQQTLLYACCCEDLAGEDWLVDGGYTKW
jgi:NAD(P)-dependent dehydrogenase (short-subunit alcohol dehydrogenase family)